MVGAMPKVVWHLLDMLCVFLIAYSMEQIVRIRDQKIKYSAIFSLLMMYQVITMRSAGWIATTINYSWVAAAGLYMYLVVQRIRSGERVAGHSYLLALFAAALAFNHESLCGMMFLFLGLLLIVDIRERNFKKALIPFYVINLLELLWILCCPGNRNRRLVETRDYFPEYAQYSFARKVFEGLCSLLSGLFDIRGMIILTTAFTLLLLYLSIRNQKPLAIRLLAVFVLLYEGAKYVYFGMEWLSDHKMLRARLLLTGYRDLPAAALLGSAVLFCLLLVLCVNAGGIKERILLLGALLCAMATKLILGFSLAFAASGERTSLFLAFTLMLSALFLIEKYEGQMAFFHRRWFMAGLVLMNLTLFAWNYVLVCSTRIW